MGRIPQKRRRWKKKVTDRREAVKMTQGIAEINDLDIKVSLIRALIPIGLERVGELLQKEVLNLAGPKGTHGKENTRWGKQNGSIYLQDQKVPIEVPRVRNKIVRKEIPLQTYQKLQRPYQADEKIFKKLLNGLGMNRYEESARMVSEVFGLSPSNISHRFKKATALRLRHLRIRRLG